MVSIASIAQTASLIGDLARASMLTALMDGRALTATELSRVAGIAPQTASGHLTRLVEAGLLVMERQGRHRYHRLASPAVAHMIESIMSLSVDPDTQGARPRSAGPVTGPRDKALRYARTCYDHLAGQLAVDMTDHLVASGCVELSGDGGLLTDAGDRFLRSLGVDVDSAHHRASGRGTGACSAVLVWTGVQDAFILVVRLALQYANVIWTRVDSACSGHSRCDRNTPGPASHSGGISLNGGWSFGDRPCR